ncbi:UNVERIFIED_CONTAM: hypothetical protein RMT77_001355 [Armadillidium vulgare]
MTKKNRKKFVDEKMNSVPENKNNGADPYKNSFQTTSGWNRNNRKNYDAHQNWPGNSDFKYDDQGINYFNKHNNEGREQNTNHIKGIRSGPNFSQSEGNDSYLNRGRGQNNHGSYYKNMQQIDSKSLKEINTKKSITDNIAVKDEGNDYQREVLKKNWKDDYPKSKDNDKFEENSKKNVRYELQETFLKNLNSASNSSESIGSKTKNSGNLSEPEKPVPLPRTSVKKHEDEDDKGARKKRKGNNDKNQMDIGFCMNCEKIIAKRDLHRDHRVLPLDNAITELKEKDQNKIVTEIEKTNSQLADEMQTKFIINLFETSINPCLSNVFKELKTSTDHNTDQLHEIRDSGMKIMNGNSIENITDMMKLMDFRNKSHNILSQNQKLLSDLKQNSCWLIFSWFKISIGLIVQSGVKIFTVLNSQSSAPSYANFDLYGDRLRLFSFKRNISPKKDAMIIPFESIRALFKNEDSKSFMIVGNSSQDGQVVFRINKEVFWGQQFISLCLGDSGPSLRNTRFFRSCGRGKPQHHIWGGDYSQNDGSGGETFLPWNEPLKQNSEEIVKGLVAARYGYNDKSSIFRIYIKGNEQTSRSKENFCFGYVEEGMETLEFFASQSDVTKTTIKDAGCFLVLK